MTSKFDQYLENVDPLLRFFTKFRARLSLQIEKMLVSKKWSQRDLARAADLKESYVSRLLRGDANPTLKTIAKLSSALGGAVISFPVFEEESNRPIFKIDLTLDEVIKDPVSQHLWGSIKYDFPPAGAA